MTSDAKTHIDGLAIRTDVRRSPIAHTLDMQRFAFAVRVGRSCFLRDAGDAFQLDAPCTRLLRSGNRHAGARRRRGPKVGRVDCVDAREQRHGLGRGGEVNCQVRQVEQRSFVRREQDCRPGDFASVYYACTICPRQGCAPSSSWKQACTSCSISAFLASGGVTISPR